ncbi:hypothetical protein AB5I41_14290 [Sphingomonas sp. MMS24-JH45]
MAAYQQFRDALKAEAEELRAAIVAETGTPLLSSCTGKSQMDAPIASIDSSIETLRDYEFERGAGRTASWRHVAA